MRSTWLLLVPTPPTDSLSSLTHTPIPPVFLRNGTNENLLPNTFGCARLRTLDRAFAELAAKVHNPSLEPLDSRLSPVCGGSPPRIDGHPRLNGILDTVKAASAHGIKVDPVFKDPKVAETMEKAVCAEWFSGYQSEGEFERAFERST